MDFLLANRQIKKFWKKQLFFSPYAQNAYRNQTETATQELRFILNRGLAVLWCSYSTVGETPPDNVMAVLKWQQSVRTEL